MKNGDVEAGSLDLVFNEDERSETSVLKELASLTITGIDSSVVYQCAENSLVFSVEKLDLECFLLPGSFIIREPNIGSISFLKLISGKTDDKTFARAARTRRALELAVDRNRSPQWPPKISCLAAVFEPLRLESHFPLARCSVAAP
jgi:hypothetical protein